MSQQSPLVSIVIPSHDYGRFLAASIESALAQTHRPLEVLVIDDGSSDDSVAVAARYLPRIRLLEQENAGVVATCNRGAREASGEWLCFLSADDTFAPTYVERMLQALADDPVASFAYSDMQLVGGREGVVRSLPFSVPVLMATGANIGGSPLTRRADFLALGGYAGDLEGVGCEDWDFWLRMAEHGHRGAHVPEPLVEWRWHDAGSRNPRARGQRLQVAETIRTRHRSLYPNRPGVLNSIVLKLAWAAQVTGSRSLLQVVEGLWDNGRLACAPCEQDPRTAPTRPTRRRAA